MSQRCWGPEQPRQGLPAGLQPPCSLSAPGSVWGFPCPSSNNSHQDHILVLLETKCLWARTGGKKIKWLWVKRWKGALQGWGLTPWEQPTGAHSTRAWHNGDNVSRSWPGCVTWGWQRLPESQGSSLNRWRSHTNTLQQCEQGFRSHVLTSFQKQISSFANDGSGRRA